MHLPTDWAVTKAGACYPAAAAPRVACGGRDRCSAAHRPVVNELAAQSTESRLGEQCARGGLSRHWPFHGHQLRQGSAGPESQIALRSEPVVTSAQRGKDSALTQGPQRFYGAVRGRMGDLPLANSCETLT